MTEGNTNYVGSILGEERDQSDDPPPLEIDNKGGLSNIVFLHGRDIKIYLVVLFIFENSCKTKSIECPSS